LLQTFRSSITQRLRNLPISPAKPRLLILDHVSSASTEGLLKEMTGRYSGRVVVGRDLEVY